MFVEGPYRDMSRYERVLRVAVSLLVVGFLATLLSFGLRYGLAFVGLPPGLSAPIGIVVAIAVALPVADVYTPVGRAPRTEAIQELGWQAVAVDLVVAGGVALVVATGSTTLGVATGVGLLANQTVVILLGAGAGYGAFILRNRDYYVRR